MAKQLVHYILSRVDMLDAVTDAMQVNCYLLQCVNAYHHLGVSDIFIFRCQILITNNELNRCEQLLRTGSELTVPPFNDISPDLTSILLETLHWISLNVELCAVKSDDQFVVFIDAGLRLSTLFMEVFDTVVNRNWHELFEKSLSCWKEFKWRISPQDLEDGEMLELKFSSYLEQVPSFNTRMILIACRQYFEWGIF